MEVERNSVIGVGYDSQAGHETKRWCLDTVVGVGEFTTVLGLPCFPFLSSVRSLYSTQGYGLELENDLRPCG